MNGQGREWDVIIVGASFGGLAAAIELAGWGRVLLLDRKPPGEGQTSACATPLIVLDRLGALDAVQQVHTEIVIHAHDGPATALVPDLPFATFDYRRLCQLLHGRTDATFCQAVVRGRDGNTVSTASGSFRAPLLIDASGCRAVLSGGNSVAGRRSLGLEVEMPVIGEGLHLWFGPPELECGMAWAFPSGASSRIGVACYRGKGGLKASLAAFSPGSGSGAVHGGQFPSQLGEPARGGIFNIGDAAGQCLPVTGEGIRPALVFGQAAGRLARSVLRREIELENALSAYDRLVRRRAPYYAFLATLQDVLLGIPRPLAPGFTRLMAACFQTGLGQRSYWWAANPLSLNPGSAMAAAGGIDRVA